MPNPENQATDAVAPFQNPTEEQIAAWETVHGKVKRVEVDGKLFCFSQPTRAFMRDANKVLVATKNPDTYADTIINKCLLNGQDELKRDVEIYLAIQQVVDKIVTSKVAELKN